MILLTGSRNGKGKNEHMIEHDGENNINFFTRLKNSSTEDTKDSEL